METALNLNIPMLLIRIVVGFVFLLEGALKFLRPAELGATYFASIGLPFSHFMAPLVGVVEVAGAAAILLNFYAGDAALALLAVMVAALITTKLPILLGRPLGPFAPEKLNNSGWLSFFHAARIDLCMIFGLLAIAIDSGLKMGRRRRWYQSGS
jgi:uncharacterized membrane protein YphA (DoxX/SURF4 family)